MTLVTRRILPDQAKAVRKELAVMSARVVARHDDLNAGDHGLAIKDLQAQLKALGLFHGDVNAAFGPATEAAVKRLQHAEGLPTTGVVDRSTLAALKKHDLFVRSGFRTAAHVNQKGKDVLGLERQLHSLGLKTGKVDGVFDSATAHAVRVFQHHHHLKPTGVVGHGTAHAVHVALQQKHDADFRKRVLDIARHNLGYREGPNNSNKFSRLFGRDHEPWCADFVSYCYTKAGKKLNQPWTPSLLQTLKDNGSYTRSHPKPGDIVMFDWHPGSGNSAEHTGLVEKVYKKNGQWYVQTIEGNSGDMVRRNQWPVSASVIAGFGTIR